MWNLISHFLTFAGGMASGVMLMCLMQTGKLANTEHSETKHNANLTDKKEDND
ncbi:MAG: DUF3789 domain-containing protein [Blautia massiliensis (ex Durand et al. 2017)]